MYVYVLACQAIIHLEKFVGGIYEGGWVGRWGRDWWPRGNEEVEVPDVRYVP